MSRRTRRERPESLDKNWRKFVYLGSAKILLQTKIEREIDAQYLSADKVSAQFGWKAEVNLDDGLQQTIEWYKTHFDQIV